MPPKLVPRPGFRQAVQGFLEPSAVPQGEAETFAGQVGKMGQLLRDKGLQTQVPQMEAPETADPGVLQETQRRERLAGLLRGLTGTMPVTSYGAKLGHRAGMALNSPTDQANAAAAYQPWEAEQARIKSANAMHAFHNQYSQMKTLAQNTDTQRALDMAQQEAISAGYRNALNAQMKMAVDDMNLRRDQLKASIGYKDFAMGATKRRLEIADEKEARAQAGNHSDRSDYTMAMATLTQGNTLHQLLQDPDIVSLSAGKHMTWGDFRYSDNPKAQALWQTKNAFHQYIIQMDKRMTSRFGTSLLGDSMPKLGDDAGVDQKVVEGLLRVPKYLKSNLEQTYPGIKNGASDADFGAVDFGFDVDAELKNRGWE